MRFDFVVLGATGMQGKIVSRDLLENGYSVLLCGRDKSRILHLLKKPKTGFDYIDLRDIDKTAKTIKKSGAKVVVCCAEGDWNLNALKACIKAGANSVDLGSDINMTKEQLGMNDILKRKNLTHITSCGSVTGIGNVMLNYASKKFDSLDSIDVGFVWNSNIKKFAVPFSIQSIIEEITDPATVIENRKIKKVSPLDTITTIHHKRIGEQKYFIVDHSELYTFYHYFKNKGLKNIKFYAGFPPHSFDKIMAMIELGLGSKDEIDFKGQKIKPVDFLTQVLKRLGYPKGYQEKEDLWLRIHGKHAGKNKMIEMECMVYPLKGWEDAGCNIDTGMPASIIAQMVKEGIISEKGSFSPEAVVPEKMFFEELRKRTMVVMENGKVIN